MTGSIRREQGRKRRGEGETQSAGTTRGRVRETDVSSLKISHAFIGVRGGEGSSLGEKKSTKTLNAIHGDLGEERSQ